MPSINRTEAVKLLQTSNDWAEVEGALKVAVSDPKTRTQAIEFLDRPGLYEKFLINWQKTHPWPRDKNGNKIGESADEHFYKYLSDFEVYLIRSFNGPDALAIFEVYKHLDQSDLACWSDAIDGLQNFIKAGSLLEQPFLSYLEDCLFRYQHVIYQNGNDYTRGGFLDSATGQFRTYLTAEQKANVSGQTKIVKPLHPVDDVVGIMMEMVVKNNSTLALDRLHALFSSDKLWDQQPQRPPYIDQEDRLRYDPRLISLYHQLLLNPNLKDKTGLVFELFQIVPPDSNTTTIYDLKPESYAPLLAFITSAKRMNLSPDLQRNAELHQMVAGGEVIITSDYAKNHLTPPSDSELDKLIQAASPSAYTDSMPSKPAP